MEIQNGITFDIKSGEKFDILLLTRKTLDKELQRLSLYRRKEYGIWPMSEICAACEAFEKLYEQSGRPGVLRSLVFAREDSATTVWVLFSTGSETFDPYKGRGLFYNEKPASEFNQKDILGSDGRVQGSEITIRLIESDKAERQILLMSSIINQHLPVHSWKTRTIGISLIPEAGLWYERRIQLMRSRFDQLYDRFANGDRLPLKLRDPVRGTDWTLSFGGINETAHGATIALTFDPE
jgi:hypothetical protein